MAIKTKTEILAAIQTRFGDDTSDDALAFIEDITDTLTDLETRASGETNWEQKYRDNDAAWRKRYQERFFNGDGDPNTDPKPQDDDEHDKEKPLTFENLFKED